jgi:hypothetical protein
LQKMKRAHFALVLSSGANRIGTSRRELCVARSTVGS